MNIPVAPSHAIWSSRLRAWAAALQVLGAAPLLLALVSSLRHEATAPHFGIASFLSAFDTAGALVLVALGLPIYSLGYALGLVHFLRRDTIPTLIEYVLLALPSVTLGLAFVVEMIGRTQ